MSHVSVVCGNALNSVHVHCRTGLGPCLSVNTQSSVRTCGVGPADSTGKSVTSDCPGGRRALVSGDRERPLKPRVGMLNLGARALPASSQQSEPTGPP